MLSTLMWLSFHPALAQPAHVVHVRARPARVPAPRPPTERVPSLPWWWWVPVVAPPPPPPPAPAPPAPPPKPSQWQLHDHVDVPGVFVPIDALPNVAVPIDQLPSAFDSEPGGR